MRDNKNITPYDRVLTARKKDRPLITDYIDGLFEDFIELKGDRLSREDNSILGGIAMFHGMPVTVIGHHKGRTTKESISRALIEAVRGNVEDGLFFSGANAEKVDGIYTVKETMDSIENEWRQ